MKYKTEFNILLSCFKKSASQQILAWLMLHKLCITLLELSISNIWFLAFTKIIVNYSETIGLLNFDHNWSSWGGWRGRGGTRKIVTVLEFIRFPGDARIKKFIIQTFSRSLLTPSVAWFGTSRFWLKLWFEFSLYLC